MKHLDQLQSGESMTISTISDGPHMHDLLHLGLVPGSIVRMVQFNGSLVVSTGSTRLAIDRNLAHTVMGSPLQDSVAL